MIDYDECRDPSSCNQKTVCSNIPGSYNCTCKAPYQKYGIESEYPLKEDCVIAPEKVPTEIPNFEHNFKF